jgi:hypothetical protein
LQQTCNKLATDCISRQAAIDYFVNGVSFPDEDGHPIEDSDELRKIWTKCFDGIPSAQPDLSSYSDKLWRNAYDRGRKEAMEEIIHCRECKYHIDGFFCQVANHHTSGNDHCASVFGAERRTDGCR